MQLECNSFMAYMCVKFYGDNGSGLGGGGGGSGFRKFSILNAFNLKFSSHMRPSLHIALVYKDYEVG